MKFQVALRCISGTYDGELIAVTKSPCVIGRAPNCDIRLNDSGISRRHCVIELAPGRATVADLGSTHGVLVNDQRIKGQGGINYLDRIKVGRLEFEIVGRQHLITYPKQQSLRRGDLCLQATNGPLKGHSYWLSAPQCKIGRSPDCDLRITFNSISPNHALIISQGNENWVTDLGSVHGTLVNGKRIQGKVAIKPGDRLSLARIEFLVTSAVSVEAASRDRVQVGDVAVNRRLEEASGNGASRPPDVPLAKVNGKSNKHERAVDQRATPAECDGSVIASDETDLIDNLSAAISDGAATDAIDLDDFFHSDHDTSRDLNNETYVGPSANDDDDALPEDYFSAAELDIPIIAPADAVPEERVLVDAAYIRLTKAGDALVAELRITDLSKPEALQEIKDHVGEHWPGAKSMFIVDFSRVTCDATVVLWRALVDWRKKLASKDVPLRLCGLSNDLRDSMATSSFHRLFPAYPTRTDAAADVNQIDWSGPSSAAGKTKQNREPSGSAAFGLDFLRGLPPQLVGLAAGIGSIVILAIVVFCQFLGSSDSVIVNTTAKWRQAPKATLRGAVSIQGATAKADDACVVIIWPASYIPATKHGLTAANLQPGGAGVGPYVAHANDQGEYRCEVSAPQADTAFYVLVLFPSLPRNRPVSPTDQSTLGTYFQNPDGLIGGGSYYLGRPFTSPGVETKFDCGLGETANAVP